MSALQVSKELLTSPSWNEQETKNVQLVAHFIQRLMNDHNFDVVLEQFNHHHYVQHNRSIPDGLENLVAYVKDFAARFPQYTYDVKKIMADGDTVMFHSHATIKKAHRGNDRKGLNIVDVWTIKDGKILEHWDSIQPLDFFMRLYVLFAGGKISNNNGVF